MPLHWQVLLPLLCLASGFALGDIQPVGLLVGAAFALWTLNAPRLPGGLWLSVTLLLSVALAAHALPGFSPHVLVAAVQFSPAANPIPLRLSWDKLLVGLTLLAWWLGQPRQPTGNQRLLGLCVSLTLLLVPLLAWLLDLVDWEPKWPAYLGLWLALNLGVAVLAEELVFRALLQRSLIARLGLWPGLLISAGLFGAAHLPFSAGFALVAGFAGLGYGLAFQLSQRLWVACGLHLSVNLCHLLLLSYPLKVAAP